MFHFNFHMVGWKTGEREVQRVTVCSEICRSVQKANTCVLLNTTETQSQWKDITVTKGSYSGGVGLHMWEIRGLVGISVFNWKSQCLHRAENEGRSMFERWNKIRAWKRKKQNTRRKQEGLDSIHAGTLSSCRRDVSQGRPEWISNEQC